MISVLLLLCSRLRSWLPYHASSRGCFCRGRRCLDIRRLAVMPPHPGIQFVETVLAQGLLEFHCRLLWYRPSLIVQLLEIRRNR